MDNLVVVFSGKKGSGKSSAGKYVLASYVNTQLGKKRFTVEMKDKETVLVDAFDNNKIVDVDKPGDAMDLFRDVYSVKMYSFADPLKEFCINVLGLDKSQCYGTDDDKNSYTHIHWDELSYEIRSKYNKPRRGSGDIKPASGRMTAREVMQVFGTDICRKMDPNCWARGLYSAVKNDGLSLAIVTDARFPNEVTLGTECGAKVVRLTRNPYDDNHPSETALDDFPRGEYSTVIDNEDVSMAETHDLLKKHLKNWFNSYQLV